ncbi:thioredoxin family protein [Halorhabdus salina]|uniref:thioredoxin family protein n=1 Tax=Halorhabdus salina TaxID=2750670 RepID=UPI0015EEE44D|nr:thioredoxin family protein [Halorhabdus salina]
MPLETLEPNPVWNADAHEDIVETLARVGDVTYRVWGGDWCGDCRSLLPDFGAALEAAGVPEERIEHHPVDQDKEGEGVEEYGIEYIPTVVVERDGEELARFVEDEGQPIASYLASQLESVESAV